MWGQTRWRTRDVPSAGRIQIRKRQHTATACATASATASTTATAVDLNVAIARVFEASPGPARRAVAVAVLRGGVVRVWLRVGRAAAVAAAAPAAVGDDGGGDGGGHAVSHVGCLALAARGGRGVSMRQRTYSVLGGAARRGARGRTA